MRNYIATLVFATHALCAAVLGSPASAHGLSGRRMLAHRDSHPVTSTPVPMGDDGHCGKLDEPPCAVTGCATGFVEGDVGSCKPTNVPDKAVPAAIKPAQDDVAAESDSTGSRAGRSLLRFNRSTDKDDRERAGDKRTRGRRAARPTGPTRRRTGRRAPRRARPADPKRRRTGKRAPRRARPADPKRVRTGKRAPRRARPVDPKRVRTGKRAPRRARPTDLKRVRASKRAPRRARPTDPHRRHNDKRAPARRSRPARRHHFKRAPSPTRHKRRARNSHEGRHSPHNAHHLRGDPHGKRHHGKRHHDKRHHGKGSHGHGHHAKGHHEEGHHGEGHHGEGHNGEGHQGAGNMHEHAHHHGAFSRLEKFLSRHEAHREGEGEGEGSTVYVKGDVGTILVTSSGDGYIGVSPHGKYGGKYGGGAFKIIGAPLIKPTQPQQQHHD